MLFPLALSSQLTHEARNSLFVVQINNESLLCSLEKRSREGTSITSSISTRHSKIHVPLHHTALYLTVPNLNQLPSPRTAPRIDNQMANTQPVPLPTIVFANLSDSAQVTPLHKVVSELSFTFYFRSGFVSVVCSHGFDLSTHVVSYVSLGVCLLIISFRSEYTEDFESQKRD